MYLILLEKIRVEYNEKDVTRRYKSITKFHREPLDGFAFQQSIKGEPNFASQSRLLTKLSVFNCANAFNVNE